jgi:sterol desaturase/sphingolipid hydroxylase (fatty acid hydroxylase superfamily)
MTAFAIAIADYMGHVALVVVCCAIFELVIPYEKQGPWSRLRGMIYWAFFVFGSVIVYFGVKAIVQYAGMRPLVVLDFARWAESGDWRLILLGYIALPLPILIIDFCDYWFHRAQHACAFLWRFHSVHHAIEEMNAANCAHHPTEHFFRIPFLLPLALFINITEVQVTLISAALASWGQIVHTNTRLSLGPLNHIFSWPLFHRVHHSRAPEHRDRNFASIFSFLDVLFGTAYRPRADEQIRTGLDDKREAQSLREYFVRLAPRPQAFSTSHRAPPKETNASGVIRLSRVSSEGSA